MRFAQIVRSRLMVRHAFDNSTVHAAWWRVILMLHGKPTESTATTEDMNTVLANGFRFYGYLYVALALVLLFISPLAGFVDSASSHFWVLLSLLSAVYLGFTAQLAFAGARCFPAKPEIVIPLLVTFFVSIMTWLTAFLSGSLFVVHFLAPEFKLLSTFAIATVMTFGVGSYFIEVIYLTTQSSK